MEKRLVLEDSSGLVLRSFAWTGEPLMVIRRGDTHRLELIKDTSTLAKKKIAFEDLGSLSQEQIEKQPILIGKLGHLRLLETVTTTVVDQKTPPEKQRPFYLSLAGMILLCLAFIAVVRSLPTVNPAIEEELKQQVVRIVKNIKTEAAKVTVSANMSRETTETKVTKKVESIKRMGALSVLGSLKNSNQRGGLKLNAANSSAGPGLGGTQGSGGVQTSLYAKGLVGAPLGAGANIQGAGGYGTKGKGGGQEGYGKLSLVGSTGSMPIPLGAEAAVASGLDRDQIAAVINRNLGQVRFCYEQGLQGSPDLNGRVAVDFTIGGNGLVKLAGIESSSMKSKAVEDCILMRLKTWKFPLPDGGVDVKVTYPFMLRRSGQG